MRINILTIFPEMFAPLRESILGKAEEKGIIEFNIVDIRSFSGNKHNKTDDYTFGGGQGMVFMPQPVFDALKASENSSSTTKRIYMSPRGEMLNESLVKELAAEEEITILCGHYEGVDQRILDHFDFREVSIGDYILTGGELAAMVLIDAFSRMIPGVLGDEESAEDESIYSGLLEYPHYTQPRNYEGLEVPEILLSGNHRAIYLWRLEQSLILTKNRRPDLFDSFVKEHTGDDCPKDKKLAKDELKILEKIIQNSI